MIGRILRITAPFCLAWSISSLASLGAAASVKISSKPTQNMTCSGGVCSPTAKRAMLNVGELANMLASGDVTVTSGSLAQDIDFDAALSWTSDHTLTLDSYHDLTFNQQVTVAGLGGLSIVTNDGGSGGDFSFRGKGNVKFWDDNGKLNINGQGYTLVASMRELVKAAHRSFPVALAKNFVEKKTYDHAPVTGCAAGVEGLGHAISNLTITDSKFGDVLALFGLCQGSPGQPIVIRDLDLLSIDFRGNGLQQELAPLAGALDYGVVKNVSATGVISATGAGSLAAGLIGIDYLSSVSQSHSDVAISNASGSLAGGLVIKFAGCDSGCLGAIETSYFTGNVAGGDGGVVGGAVADNISGTISNSYVSGSVTGGADGSVGGMVGKNESQNGSSAQLENSYSTGAVSGGERSTIGGLIGQDLAGGGNSNTYWDLDTSGVSNPHQGAGNIPDDPGITGLTDAQLKSGLPAGFDKKTWAQNPKINNGYPYLIANPPPK